MGKREMTRFCMGSGEGSSAGAFEEVAIGFLGDMTKGQLQLNSPRHNQKAKVNTTKPREQQNKHSNGDGKMSDKNSTRNYSKCRKLVDTKNHRINGKGLNVACV